MQRVGLIVMAFRGVLNRTTVKLVTCMGAVLLSGLAVAQQVDPTDVSRGAYLARVGDCIACHTSGPQSPPFAGGLPLNSPFGIIYSTNITPDPVTGIGNYSLHDFSRAVRNGVAKGGRRLYPAMPYPSFTAITDDDIHALYVYFMNAVEAVHHKPPETKLPFPFNIRLSLFFWDAAFVKHKRFKPQNDRDAQWNRGAYLVQSLGHCGACHTPRGLAFQEKAYAESSPAYLSGALVDNWFTANLRGDSASGLGRWSEADIAAFLERGHGGQVAAFGSMIDVIENSTQYFHKDDVDAIAHYLKSLPAYSEKATYKPDAPAVAITLAAMVTGEVERPGAGLYQSFCAKCHQVTGTGEPDKFPKLAGNSIVLSENPGSLIRLLLEGGKTAQTRGEPESRKMPSFAEKFSDSEIAEVLSFIRNSWGNAASPVTTRQVSSLRRALRKKP
ncbi:c-type cytochrome [Methylobacter tundripaludum]|uniref:c-type cytochrome n=1 Tax=Methylobacter tundripaludum TaxID=173365 RepID=UPI0004DF6DF2|nr:cytochrome c [Methylobacter tundripaludum]